MMTCREIAERTTDYLEGQLGFVARLGFRLHVGLCAGCRAWLEQIRTTVASLGELPDEPAPAPDVMRELQSRFQIWRETEPPRTESPD